MTLCFCVELFRNTLFFDATEAIAWGELLSFGTNKHPPLSGWLADGFYQLFFQHDFAIYLLGILCIAIGLIYIYKLAKYFLDSKKAVCAALIITSSLYYSHFVLYYNFNCNILAMALWPILIYYFYKSIKFDKLKFKLETMEKMFYGCSSLVNVEMNLFAPPSGDYDQNTIEIANKLGYKTILWSNNVNCSIAASA